MYQVDISPDGKQEFYKYLLGTEQFGHDTVIKLLDSYDNCIELLENNPYYGENDLPYLPKKYRAVQLYKHYWMIFQIYENKKCVKIEYIIDDRQNYISFVH